MRTVKFTLIFLGDLAIPAYRLQGRVCRVLQKCHSANPDRSVSHRAWSLDGPGAGEGASRPSAPSGLVLSSCPRGGVTPFYKQGNEASGKCNTLAKAEQS